MLGDQIVNGLIQGIQAILAEDNSSLSADEKVLLEETTSTLEELKSTQDPAIEKPLTTKVVSNILKVFTNF